MNESKFEPKTTTRYFEINGHLIWKYGLEESDILTPAGYYELKTDTVRLGSKRYVRKFFLNSVPVIATLYENETTKEIGYFFEGIEVAKEKVRTI